MYKVGKKGITNVQSKWWKMILVGELPRSGKIFVLFLLSIFAFGQLSAQSGRIKFPKTYYYFGNVKEQNGPVTKEFPFVNVGKGPLLVTKVKTTCGCTVSDYSRDSIMPGDTGTVRITFDPFGRPGIFKKPATVLTNGSPSTVTLTISGQVLPRPKGPRDYYPFKEGNIRLKTNHLTFHKMTDNKTKTLTTVLYNDGTAPISLDLAKSEVPPHLRVRISKDALAPGDTSKMWVTYDAKARENWGFLFDPFYLRTNDTERPMKRISASAHIRQYFPRGGSKARMATATGKLDFGVVTKGEIPVLPYVLKNTGTGDLIVRRIHSACSCLEFQTPSDTISPGESAPVLVSFNTRGRIGKSKKEFTLITNSPSNSELVVPVFIEIVNEKQKILPPDPEKFP